MITLVVFYTTIIIFPILIQRIYKCKIATYISPILLCFFFSDQLITVHQDSYVGIGICMVVLSIPMILILNQCESLFHKVQLLLGLIVLMSFANIGREHTSLGLFFILIYLIVLEMIRAVKNKRWLELVVYFALGLITPLSYNLCATTIPNFLLRINGQEQWLTSSTAWHSIYIGFGFFENPYNIVYLDECMMEKVREISPNIIYASNEYYDTCKELVMKLLNEDFLFCIKSFVMKAIYTLGGMVLATLRRVTRDLCIAYISFNMYKNRFNINKGFLYKRKDIIIVGCIFILAGIAPAILTAPWIHYCITAYATCQVGIMLLFLYILENKVNSRR